MATGGVQGPEQMNINRTTSPYPSLPPLNGSLPPSPPNSSPFAWNLPSVSSTQTLPPPGGRFSPPESGDHRKGSAPQSFPTPHSQTVGQQMHISAPPPVQQHHSHTVSVSVSYNSNNSPPHHAQHQQQQGGQLHPLNHQHSMKPFPPPPLNHSSSFPPFHGYYPQEPHLPHHGAPHGQTFRGSPYPIQRHQSTPAQNGGSASPPLVNADIHGQNPNYAFSSRLPLIDRPFKCDQCVQSFNRNHDLKRHRRIHLAVKPYPCTECGKTFSRKDALRRHWLVKGCTPDESVLSLKPPDDSRLNNNFSSSSTMLEKKQKKAKLIKKENSNDEYRVKGEDIDEMGSSGGSSHHGNLPLHPHQQQQPVYQQPWDHQPQMQHRPQPPPHVMYAQQGGHPNSFPPMPAAPYSYQPLQHQPPQHHLPPQQRQSSSSYSYSSTSSAGLAGYAGGNRDEQQHVDNDRRGSLVQPPPGSSSSEIEHMQHQQQSQANYQRWSRASFPFPPPPSFGPARSDSIDQNQPQEYHRETGWVPRHVSVSGGPNGGQSTGPPPSGGRDSGRLENGEEFDERGEEDEEVESEDSQGSRKWP